MNDAQKLTVNLHVKDGNTVVQEETFCCNRVIKVTTGMKGCPAEADAGLLFEFDVNLNGQFYSTRHVPPREDGLWYDCFVMNAAGVIINRHAL